VVREVRSRQIGLNWQAQGTTLVVKEGRKGLPAIKLTKESDGGVCLNVMGVGLEERKTGVNVCSRLKGVGPTIGRVGRKEAGSSVENSRGKQTSLSRPSTCGKWEMSGSFVHGDQRGNMNRICARIEADRKRLQR